MYDIDTKNVKNGKKFYFIFLAVGVFFLVILGWILISSYIKLNGLDSTTTSTKVIVHSHINDEGSTLYSPVYYYEVNGKEYMCSSNSSSSIHPGTSNKIVYYDSKNPSTCMTEYSKSSNKILLIFMLLPLIFIVMAVINMRKISKRTKLINELNQKGKLVKNLPYHLEDTGMAVNGVQIKRPVVDYTLPSGSVITLYGDPRHDRKTSDADGMVDLVIDEKNPDNYFIDFEINRLTGNLATDYYTNGQNSLQNKQATVKQLNNEINKQSFNSLNNNFQQSQVDFQPNQAPSQINEVQPQTNQEINQQNYINQNNHNNM